MFAKKNRVGLSSAVVHRVLLGVTVIGALANALAGTAAAQRYKDIKPKVNLKQAKALARDSDNALRNPGAFNAGGKQAIDRYYKDFVFRAMTQQSADRLANLGKLREDLLKRLRNSPVPAAQTHLTKTVFTAMRAITQGNYHPAVRYNATLILGLLDQKYAVGGTEPQPPVVLPAATAELLKLLEQKEFKGVLVHPSVKVAALEGLQRHVRFGMDPQYQDRVTQVAMAVLAQSPDVLNVNVDVNNWMKCEAARVLAWQFRRGPNQQVHAALTKLIASSKLDLADRCCIAGLLKDIKYDAAPEADVAATLQPLGDLTKAVVAEGAEQARDFETLVLDGNRGGGGFGGGGFGGRGAAQGPKLERRELLDRLKSIGQGAKSLSAGLPDAEKQKVENLLELLAPVIEVSQNPKALDLDVTGEVLKLEESIDSIVSSWQPAAAAAAATDAAFTE